MLCIHYLSLLPSILLSRESPFYQKYEVQNNTICSLLYSNNNTLNLIQEYLYNIMKSFEREIFFVFSILSSFQCCTLQGTDSGECTLNTLDPLWRAMNMPFCQNVVIYPACIPQFKVIVNMIQHLLMLI